MIECRNITMEMNGRTLARIINMVNPPFSGPVTPFRIEVLEANTSIVREVLTFDGNI